MWIRSLRWVFFSAVVVVSAGCGGGGTQQPITFDTGPTPTFASTTSPPNISVPISGATVPATAAPSAPVGSAAVPATTTVAGDASWQDVTGQLAGLSSECGTISFVAASPIADVVVAGIGQQGLWSAGAGDHWTPMGSGTGSAVVDNRPFALVFDPKDPKTFWEGGGYHGNGVFQTTDGGATFHQLGDLTHIQTVGVDFTDPARATLLAGSHERAGLFRSTDGGRQWTDITSALPQIGYITGLAVLGPQTFLIGTTGVNGQDSKDGVFRSTDGGKTWTSEFVAPVVGVPLVSASDGAIYWILGQAKGVIRSTDGGLTWDRVNAGAVLHPNVPMLSELGDGTLVGVGRSNLVRSSDRGVTWQAFGPSLPFQDPSSLTYAPARDALYLSRFDCDVSVPTQPVTPGSVFRLDIAPAA